MTNGTTGNPGFGRIVRFTVLALAALGATAAHGANFTSWAKVMPVRFAGYTAAGTLTNFPVLVQFAEGSNGFHYADLGSPTNAADLRFTDATGTNEINYEIDTWTTNGVSSVWVQVPALASSTTTIDAFYGQSGQTAPGYTTDGSTWASGYVGVYHFAETNGTTIKNSTAYGSALNGSVSNFNAALTMNANGWIGTGKSWADEPNDGTTKGGMITIPDHADLRGPNNITISCWLNPVDNSATHVGRIYAKSDGNPYYLKFNSDNNLVGYFNGSQSPATGEIPGSYGSWQHVAWAYDSAVGKTNVFYKSGLPVLGTTASATLTPDAQALVIGNRLDALRTFHGSMDEFRVSKVTRAPNWIWAEFMNAASNRTFNLYSTATPPLGVTITNPAHNANIRNNGPNSINIGISVVEAIQSATVTNVAVYANGTLLGTVSASPYNFVWNTAADGCYSLKAVAYDSLGQVTTSGVVNVTLGNWMNWSKRMNIRFAGYTAAGTLTNFPVLVQFAEGSNGFHYADLGSPANAADLRFADAAGVTELNYEIDTWSTTGVSSVWVQVPQLADANSSMQAFYGRSGQVAPAYTTNGATWSGGFEAVWHLSETNGSPAYADSTLKHNATPLYVPCVQASGEIGSAQLFYNAFTNHLTAGTVNLGNSMCLSAWVNLNGGDNNIQTVLASKYGGNNQNGFALCVNSYQTSDKILYFDSQDGTSEKTAATPSNLVTYAVWHHVAAVVDRANGAARLYMDGVDQTGTNPVLASFGNNQSINIGSFKNDTGAYQLQGALDEVRIETVLRSSNWVWAAYMNSASNRTFALYSNAANQTHAGTLVLFR